MTSLMIPPPGMNRFRSALVDWIRGAAGILPEPEEPFLVEDVAEDVPPGKMQESAFLAAVARGVVARRSPELTADEAESQTGVAVTLLKLAAGAIESLCSLEALVRAATGHAAAESVDGTTVAAELANVLAAEIEEWTRDDAPEGTFTPDEIKSQLLDAIALAPMPPDMAARMNAVSEKLPVGSRPSTFDLGQRVHRHVQRSYCALYVNHHVVCDSRWRYLGSWSQTISGLALVLRPGEMDRYTPKLRVYREAMKPKPPDKNTVRPDIFDLDEDTAYEIKPRQSGRAAYVQLHQVYIPRYNEERLQHQPVVPPMRGGPWWPPLLFYPDVPTETVSVIRNEGEGAIIYDVYDIPGTKRFLAIAIALGLLHQVVKQLRNFRVRLPGPALSVGWEDADRVLQAAVLAILVAAAAAAAAAKVRAPL